MEVQRILEKADYVKKSTVVNKQFIDNEKLKYSENSNTGILIYLFISIFFYKIY